MLADFPDARKILNSAVTYRGRVWEIVRDEIQFADEVIVRDYLRHPGAVAIVAVDENNQVLLINQYRHPVGQTMIEIPAGMLDDFNEDPLSAAKRELLEESGYVAKDWKTLIDVCTTPGSSSEAIRIYLARDLQFEPNPNYVKKSEEAEITVSFAPLSDAVSAIFGGLIQSPTAVSGILALNSADLDALRPADTNWPIRDHLLSQNRVFKF